MINCRSLTTSSYFCANHYVWTLSVMQGQTYMERDLYAKFTKSQIPILVITTEAVKFTTGMEIFKLWNDVHQ